MRMLFSVALIFAALPSLAFWERHLELKTLGAIEVGCKDGRPTGNLLFSLTGAYNIASLGSFYREDLPWAYSLQDADTKLVGPSIVMNQNGTSIVIANLTPEQADPKYLCANTEGLPDREIREVTGNVLGELTFAPGVNVTSRKIKESCKYEAWNPLVPFTIPPRICSTTYEVIFKSKDSTIKLHIGMPLK